MTDRSAPFIFRGCPHPLYHHMYNSTWLNERACELSVWRSFHSKTAATTLEVGNVLSHYEDLPQAGMVVDRWEKAPGVINDDVFDITGMFDEIVAISTLEHVRWDEEPREAGGSQDAFEHLASLLAPMGQMMVTVPTGHNPPLDEWLASGDTSLGLASHRAVTMVRDMDSWRETPDIDIRPYGVTQDWAESVWIGQWWNHPTA